MSKEPKNGVWVGLRKCGCCVAVVVDDGDHPKDVETTKQEFLRDGLSVVNATWTEWREKYMPSMSWDCPHKTVSSSGAEAPHA